MKALVIGDVHGCFDELMDLLDQAGPSADDQIISLGDLVDRGPAAPEVLSFFSTAPHAKALMGNHERKHVRSFNGQTLPSLSQRITRHQIGDEHYPRAVEWMSRLPTSIELPEALLVHAMFETGAPLARQRESVLVGTLGGEYYLRERHSRPWHELYDGAVPIVVGHQNIGGGTQPYVRADGRVIGLDTSCYAGGALSALLLPEFRLLSVRSRANYWRTVRARHSALAVPRTDIQDTPFEQLESALANERSSSGDEPLRAWLQDVRHALAMADEAARATMAILRATHERIASGLARAHVGRTLTEGEFARAYAHAIGVGPSAPLLHALRQGRLDVNSLKARLRTPRTLHELHGLLANGG